MSPPVLALPCFPRIPRSGRGDQVRRHCPLCSQGGRAQQFSVLSPDIAPMDNGRKWERISFRRPGNGAGLLLQYLPQYDLKRGDLAGVKVLPQWEHPEMGRVSPERFFGRRRRVRHAWQLVTHWYAGRGVPGAPFLATAGFAMHAGDDCPHLPPAAGGRLSSRCSQLLTGPP
jgi:hypothetical protein